MEVKTGREGKPGAPSPHLPAPLCSPLLLSAPPLVEVVAPAFCGGPAVLCRRLELRPAAVRSHPNLPNLPNMHAAVSLFREPQSNRSR